MLRCKRDGRESARELKSSTDRRSAGLKRKGVLRFHLRMSAGSFCVRFSINMFLACSSVEAYRALSSASSGSVFCFWCVLLGDDFGEAPLRFVPPIFIAREHEGVMIHHNTAAFMSFNKSWEWEVTVDTFLRGLSRASSQHITNTTLQYKITIMACLWRISAVAMRQQELIEKKTPSVEQGIQDLGSAFENLKS